MDPGPGSTDGGVLSPWHAPLLCQNKPPSGLWVPHLGRRGCTGMLFTHHMELFPTCRPAELKADSAGAAKLYLRRDLRCFGALLHLTRGEQGLEENLRNSSTHQPPSSRLIKLRGNCKFTLPGYSRDTLETTIAAVEPTAFGHKVSTLCDICHSVFLHLDGREEVAQWTVFSLY